MNVIHDGYFTVFEYGINFGAMYAPFPYKADLNERDIKYIKKCVNELKQLELVEKLDSRKILDAICSDIYNMKHQQGLVSSYQESYI